MARKHAWWAAVLMATAIIPIRGVVAKDKEGKHDDKHRGPVKRLGSGIGRALGFDTHDDGDFWRIDRDAEGRIVYRPYGWYQPDWAPDEGRRDVAGVVEYRRSVVGPVGSYSSSYYAPSGSAIRIPGSPWFRSASGSYYAIYRDQTGHPYYALIYPNRGTRVTFFFDPSVRRYLGAYDYSTRQYRPYDPEPGRWEAPTSPPFNPPSSLPYSAMPRSDRPQSDFGSGVERGDRDRILPPSPTPLSEGPSRRDSGPEIGRDRVPPPEPVPAGPSDRDRIERGNQDRPPHSSPVPPDVPDAARDLSREPSRIPPPPPLPSDLSNRDRDSAPDLDRTPPPEPSDRDRGGSGFERTPPPDPVPARPRDGNGTSRDRRTPPLSPADSDSDDGPVLGRRDG